MRILFISNYYPPFELGGYEQNCRDVAEALKLRGHLVSIVTSNYRASRVKEPDIYRVLNTELDLRPHYGTYSVLNRSARLAQSASRLKTVIEKRRPDVVFIWGMGNLPREILTIVERDPALTVVYYISDYWPMSPDFSRVHWESPAAHPATALPKKLLATYFLGRKKPQYRLCFEHPICVSSAVRDRLVQAGLPFEKAKVVHNGIDTTPFQTPAIRASDGELHPLRIVYAGRVAPEKDLCTLIIGFSEAVKAGIDTSLTIVGRGNREYVDTLHSLVSRQGIEPMVSFRDWVSRADIPKLLSHFEVFVSASSWEEPLSLSVQQAMAAGLAVVATPMGGMREIVVDGENGLFFALGDTTGLANQIRRLALDPGLRVRLSESGRRTVMSHFSIERMTDEIEEYLRDAISVKTRSARDPDCRI